MKKFITFMAVMVGILVAAVLITGLIEPKEVIVTRTTLINAPKEAVFQQIQLFKNWPNWSPWYRMDSTMKLTYAGTDGQPGSSYHWEGTDKTGAGDMKNIAINGTQMNFEVDFTRPYTSSSQGIIQAKDTGSMTKVTWNCTVKMSFPMNASFFVLNMDKLLGGDFESGLANMKQYVEAHTAPVVPIVIKELDFPEHIYAGIRKTVGMAELAAFFTDNKNMAANGSIKATGSYTGLFYKWDTTTNTTDAAAVFPVLDTTALPKDIVVIHVPAAKAYMAVLKGGYANEMKYHYALHQRLEANGKKQLLVVEEYPSGTYNEPDSNKWVTNIYYLIQQ